ncbi:MAG TPA: hypothetical protein VFJ95_14560 [Gammaproteobacteria bacterium]|nr:hypothetical protein [Gammaproteobacteria bacterium]
MAVTAVFGADLAQHRFGEARRAQPNERMAASLPKEADRTLDLAPGARFRSADADAARAAHWRLPEAFDYHPSTFDSATADAASARRSKARDDASPPQDAGAPRRQF